MARAKRPATEDDTVPEKPNKKPRSEKKGDYNLALKAHKNRKPTASPEPESVHHSDDSPTVDSPAKLQEEESNAPPEAESAHPSNETTKAELLAAVEAQESIALLEAANARPIEETTAVDLPTGSQDQESTVPQSRNAQAKTSKKQKASSSSREEKWHPEGFRKVLPNELIEIFCKDLSLTHRENIVRAFHSKGIAENGYFDQHGLFQVLHIAKNGLPEGLLDNLEVLFMSIEKLHVYVAPTKVAQIALRKVLQLLTSIRLRSFTFSERSSITAETSTWLQEFIRSKPRLLEANIPKFNIRPKKRQSRAVYTVPTPQHGLTNTSISGLLETQPRTASAEYEDIQWFSRLKMSFQGFKWSTCHAKTETCCLPGADLSVIKTWAEDCHAIFALAIQDTGTRIDEYRGLNSVLDEINVPLGRYLTVLRLMHLNLED